MKLAGDAYAQPVRVDPDLIYILHNCVEKLRYSRNSTIYKVRKRLTTERLHQAATFNIVLQLLQKGAVA